MSKGCLFGLSLVLFIGIHVSSAALNESTVCVKLETFNLLKSCYKNCGKLQCAFHEYCDDGRCLYCSDAKCQSPPKGCELFCSKRKADTYGYSFTSKPGLNCTCSRPSNEMGLQIMHDNEATWLYVSLSINGVFLVASGLTLYFFGKTFFKKFQNGGKGRKETNGTENSVRLIANDTDGNSPSNLVVTGI
uniref:Uncharacterized protein LOC111117932 n=1 Tax=Crassostrea virginica TaxID=6565 RepID=A0A8B8CAU6_CRAVI|nr:uncharacterized protein LOC111117932 [Crassostrea virginica]XP_022312883.1 uncharacterized protein LOC111117933 [Crassostrea virginica]